MPSITERYNDRRKGDRPTAETPMAEKADVLIGKFDILSTIRRFVEDGLSYNEVKRRLNIPTTWGAKITGAQFRERTTD
jgi:hypothetical protein